MLIRRVSPVTIEPAMLSQISRVMDDMVRETFGDVAGSAPARAFPPLNVWEDEKAIHVEAELPGVDPSKIDVKVEHGALSISGSKEDTREEKGKNFHRSERVFGSFFRQVAMPDSIDPDQVKAEFNAGVLSVSVQKRNGGAARKIPVVSKN